MPEKPFSAEGKGWPCFSFPLPSVLPVCPSSQAPWKLVHKAAWKELQGERIWPERQHHSPCGHGAEMERWCGKGGAALFLGTVSLRRSWDFQGGCPGGTSWTQFQR